MSDDAEFEKWKQDFQTEEDTMNIVLKTFRRSELVRRALSIYYAFFVVLLVGVGIAELLTDRTAHGLALAAYFFVVPVALAMLWRAQLGSSRGDGARTPGGMVELMGQRLDSAKRASRWVPWFATAVALAVAALMMTSPSSPAERRRALALCVFTAVGGWVAPIFGRRRISRRRLELERWRQELDG